MRNTSHTWRAVLGLFLASMCVGPAFGGISVVNDNRYLHIGSAKFDQTQTATPLANFDQTLSNTATYPDGRVDSASAQQTSSVAVSGGTLHIVASGTGSFSATYPPHNDNVFTDSIYSIEFTLDAPASYTAAEQSSLQNLGGQDGEMSYFGAKLMQGQTNLLPTLQGTDRGQRSTCHVDPRSAKGGLRPSGL